MNKGSVIFQKLLAYGGHNYLCPPPLLKLPNNVESDDERFLLCSVALCLVQVYLAIVSQQENVSGREPAVVLRVDRT